MTNFRTETRNVQGEPQRLLEVLMQIQHHDEVRQMDTGANGKSSQCPELQQFEQENK